MIGIIDYGLGNLRSVSSALQKLGTTPIISSDPTLLSLCTKLILPGVGAFGDGMLNLKERGLDRCLSSLVLDEKKPILGICLGAQLFASEGFEFGHHQGLGWISASVRKIEVKENEVKLPHIGWNEISVKRASPILQNIIKESQFYFTHSFFLDAKEDGDVIATTSYGHEFPAILQRENIYAVQFHPEKSQSQGLALLKNFIELP